MMAWGESDGTASATWMGRSALVERLAHATDDGGVAVIAAEAGTGKTALLRQWLAGRARSGVHVARTGTTRARRGADRAREWPYGRRGRSRPPDRRGSPLLGAVQRDHGGTLVRRRPQGPAAAGGRPGAHGRGSRLVGGGRARRAAALGAADVRRRGQEIAWISEGWCVAVRLAAAAGPPSCGPRRRRCITSSCAKPLPRSVPSCLRPPWSSRGRPVRRRHRRRDPRPPGGGAELIATLRRNRLFLRPAGAQGAWRFHRLFLQAARRELQSGPGARKPRRAARDDAARRLARLPASHPASPTTCSTTTCSRRMRSSSCSRAPSNRRRAACSCARRAARRWARRHRAGRSGCRRSRGRRAAAGRGRRARRRSRRRAPPGQACRRARCRGSRRRAAGGRCRRRRAPGVRVAGARHAESTGPTTQQAEEHLELAASLADHAGRWGLAARAWAALALLAATAGRLRVADQRLDMVDRTAVVPTEAAVRAAVAQSAIAILRDDLGRASRHADVARRALQRRGTRCSPCTCCSPRPQRSRRRAATRSRARASPRARPSGHRCPAGVYQSATLDVYRVRLLDRAGRHDEAAEVLDGIAQREHPVVALAIARRSIVADDPAGALTGLRPSMHAAGRAAGRPSASHLLLYATAVERVGVTPTRPTRRSSRRSTSPGEGLRRAFVDEGVPVRALLEDHLRRATAHAAFISDVLDHVASRRPAPEAELRSQLTERETRGARLPADGDDGGATSPTRSRCPRQPCAPTCITDSTTSSTPSAAASVRRRARSAALSPQ